MIQGICETLEISEHELLTASDDYRQREIESQAAALQRTKKNYTWIWAAVYIVSLVPCLIANIVSSGAPTWFFIVLTAEMTAFSLINLPVLVKDHKGLWTAGGFYASLIALLVSCRLYNGGDWLIAAVLGITLGLSVILLPFILKDGLFPEKLRSNKGAVCMAADSVLLILLVLWVSGRAGGSVQAFSGRAYRSLGISAGNKVSEYKSDAQDLGMSCFRRSFCGFPETPYKYVS